MLLTNIGLVNWHTYNPIDIPVTGNIIGVVGDNGAGKSTLLDALYLVMSGGDSRNINKRAQGGSKSEGPITKRTIHSYCLGTMNESTLRKDCTTYLLAGFEDPKGKKEPVTLLMAFHATSDNKKEYLEARAVIKGALIKTTDIIGADENGKKLAMTWDELRPILEKKVTEVGGSLVTYPKSMKAYVEAYLQAMMYHGHYEREPQYSKNLENAIALKDINSATDFVRDFVLPKNDIDIVALRSTASAFNKLVEQLKLVKSQINEVEGLINVLDKTLGAERSKTIEASVKVMSDAVLSRRKNRLQSFLIGKNNIEITAIDGELAKINNELSVIKTDISRLEKSKHEMGAASFIEMKRAQIVAHRHVIDQTLARLLGEKGIGKLAHKIRYQLQSLCPDNALLSPFVSLNEAVNGIGKASIDYLPENGHAADKAFSDTITAISEHLPALKEQQGLLLGEASMVEKECKELQTQISNIESQKSVREKWLNDFVNMLHKHDIEADILFEITDINDEEWRDSIEALLGGLRDTIFVSVEGFDLAAKLLDDNKREYSRVRLASSTKLLRHSYSFRSNTIGSILTSDNKLVMSFIDMKFGNIQLTSDLRDFKKDGRWVTKSGLFDDGASVVVLNPTRPKIGKNGLQQSLPLLKHDLEIKTEKYLSMRQTLMAFSQLITDISRVSTIAEDFSNLDNVFSTSKHEIISRSEQIEENLELIEAKNEECDTTSIDEELVSLNEAFSNLTAHKKELDNKRSTCFHQIQTATTLLKDSVNTLGSNEHMNAKNTAFRLNAVSIPADTLKQALAVLKLRWKTEGGLKSAENALTEIRKIAHNEHTKAADYLNKSSFDTKITIGRVLDSLGARTALPDEYGIEEHLYPWAVKALDELKNNDLIDYEAQFEISKKQADEIFKTSFILELAGKFNEVERSISSLNSIIKNTEFIGENYKLKWNYAPGREVFHRVVKNENEISAAETGGGLLKGILSQENKDDMDEIKSLMFSPDEKIDLEEYTDYRKYYTFELEMTNCITGEKSTLTQRKGTASGGEKQTPCYICILTAMSTVYYGGPFKNIKSDEGGLCLSIFDEAFSNMDENVTQKVVDLGRKLGLQMVICAPSNKKVGLQRACDTVLTVSRTADHKHTRIYGEGIKERTRKELAYLDPSAKSDSEIEAIMMMEAS